MTRTHFIRARHMYQNLWADMRHYFTSIGQNKRKLRCMDEVYKQLTVLLDAGIPLQQCIDYMQTMSLTRLQSGYVQDLKRAINLGEPVSSVWAPLMPPFLKLLLATGEASGKVSDAMKTWVDFVSRRADWRKGIAKASAYPLVLLVSTMGLLEFLVRVLFPALQQMYENLNAQLPRSILFAQSVFSYLPIAIIGLPVLIIITVAGLRRWGVDGSGRLLHMSRKTPGFWLVRSYRTWMLSLLMSVLLGAGLPIIDALNALEGNAAMPWLRRVAAQAKFRLYMGESLTRVFSADFDPILTMELGVAEQTGELLAALTHVEALVHRSLTERIDGLVHKLEPALTVFMGLMVGAAMYALFVPLYTLVSQVAQSAI